jgi:hypothetical protein
MHLASKPRPHVTVHCRDFLATFLCPSVFLTVKQVGLDLRRPVFTHGQFYVRISGVTSMFNIKAIWEPNKEEAVTKNIVYNEVLLN